MQFFAPGITQVYYVGLLNGENDLERVETAKNGRDNLQRITARIDLTSCHTVIESYDADNCVKNQSFAR